MAVHVPPPPQPTTVRRVSCGAAYIAVLVVFVLAVWHALGVFEPVPPSCKPSALSKGMVPADVLVACGKPKKTDREEYLDGSVKEFWFYSGSAVYFVDGRVANAIWTAR
jgi:hypothetical protein